MTGVAFGIGVGIAVMLFFECRYKKLYELEKSCTERLEKRVKSIEDILHSHYIRIATLEHKTDKPTSKVTLIIDGVNYEVRGGYGNGVL